MQITKKNCLPMAVIYSLIALCLVTTTSSLASTKIEGKPNLNGIWQAMNTANWNLEAHSAEAMKEHWALGSLAAIPAGQSVVEEGTIPYLDEALAQREENRAGSPNTDPETKCYLPGVPRATYMPFPFQIVQGGDDIIMVYTYASTNRLIHMEDHKEPPVDTWMGRSNGQWEGDDLVVVTTGFNGKPWLDRSGNFIGMGATVTERFTLISDNHIQYQATIENPTTFSKPWTISMPLYRRMEANAQILEFKCVPFVEELLYKDLELPKEQ